MKHKDGLDIAALLLLLLVAIAAMVVPVALTQPALLAVPAVLVLIALCVVLYQRRRLRRALDHAERIGKVFQIKIAAQLPAGDSVVLYARRLLHQPPFDAVFRADIVHFPARGLQARHQGQIGRDMPCRAPAGEDNTLHEPQPPDVFDWNRVESQLYYSTQRGLLD